MSELTGWKFTTSVNKLRLSALDYANTAGATHFTDSVSKKCRLYLSDVFTTTTTVTTAPAAISSKRFKIVKLLIKLKKREISRYRRITLQCFQHVLTTF